MSMTSQDYAELAEHSYDRAGNMRDLVNKEVVLEGVAYEVLEYVDNPRNGYQGTIYQRVDSGEIIVAHRGDVPRVSSSGAVGSPIPARTRSRLDMKKRFPEEQIIGFLCEAEAELAPEASDVGVRPHERSRWMPNGKGCACRAEDSRRQGREGAATRTGSASVVYLS